MIDEMIEGLKQVKQTLVELQKAYCELEKEFEKKNEKIAELKETNSVLSKELTKNSIMQQDHIETCCGIPIREIPLLKEQVTIYKKAFKLACDNLYQINFKIYNTEMNFEDYFIEKVKEELENE